MSEKSLDESSENSKLNKIDCRIVCKKATVKWPSTISDDKEPKEDEGNTLTDISFTANPGQITAVIGQVGSGKVLLRIYLYKFVTKLHFFFFHTANRALY